MLLRWIIAPGLLALCCTVSGQTLPEPASPHTEDLSPSVHEILQRSRTTTRIGFDRTPDFDYCMTDKNGDQSHTYAVFMIDGSTYDQLVSVDGVPLSVVQQVRQTADRLAEAVRRRHETPEEHERRVAKYKKEQDRNYSLLTEMAQAFHFTLAGTARRNGWKTYVLHATPRPGYQPKNTQTRVLTGMQGTLWIDQHSYGWVHAEAEVVHPVMIEGFLARVERGTRFMLEERPFDNGVWLISRFSIHAKARILFIFPRTTTEDYTFFHYVPRGTLTPEMCLPAAEPAADRTDHPKRPER